MLLSLKCRPGLSCACRNSTRLSSPQNHLLLGLLLVALLGRGVLGQPERQNHLPAEKPFREVQLPSCLLPGSFLSCGEHKVFQLDRKMRDLSCGGRMKGSGGECIKGRGRVLKSFPQLSALVLSEGWLPWDHGMQYCLVLALAWPRVQSEFKQREATWFVVHNPLCLSPKWGSH